MNPRSEEERPSDQFREQEHQRPTVYEWIGKPVFLNYSSGPSWIDEQIDPFSLARGVIEGREGIFFLSEVSNVGVLVQKLQRSGDLAAPVFIPWGAVHTIQRLPSAPESETKQETE